jgi:hypothetical protein
MVLRMRRALCTIRDLPPYRRYAFENGLRRCGFEVSDRLVAPPRSGDVLVMWNRYGSLEAEAKRFESAGAAVIVAENSYIGDPRDERKIYALAKSHHNGAGTWKQGEKDRFSDLEVDIFPWRDGGEHILVLPQRGIGPKGVAMPSDWVVTVQERLRKLTKRPVRARIHPGVHRPPLEPDFDGCHAAVTWGSGAAIKAIAAGVPVFHEFDRWIGAPAAKFGLDDLENPFLGDRMPMFRRLAYAQWAVEEIESGEAFKWLLT